VTLFQFARPTRLRDAFAAGAAGAYLNPTQVDDLVTLVHPAVGPAENAPLFASFAFSGAPGAAAQLSEVPADRIEYFLAIDIFHDQIPNIPLRLLMIEVNTALETHIYSSLGDPVYSGAGVPALQGIAIRCPIVVPPGYALLLRAPGLAAPSVATIRASVAVLNLAEPPPPLFR